MSIIDRRGIVIDETPSPAFAADPGPHQAIKAPVRVATTTSIVLSGLQTIDGVALSEGNRVLVKDQLDLVENGIYWASSGSWLRAGDFDESGEVVKGTLVHINEGATNGGKIASVMSADPNVPASTPVTIGSPVLLLANDLAALEAASGTNTIYYRSGVDTWSPVTIGGNLTFSGGTLNAVVGASASVPNLCLNPGMQVWQNSTTLTAASHRTVCADGWLWGTNTGTSVFTISRSTDVPDSSVPYSIKLDCTTADTSPPIDYENHLRYAIYGSDLLPWASADLTVKFWVKSNKTGTYCIAGINEARDRTYVMTYTINSANTWEEKSVTIPLSTKTGTWNTEHGFGIGIRFSVGSGSTHQTAAGAWQNGNFTSTSAQTNLADSTSNELFITKVQICPGMPLTFSLPDYGKAWDDARRQYRVFTQQAGAVNICIGVASSVDSADFEIVLHPPMYAAPTVSTFGTQASDWLVQSATGTVISGGTFSSFARSNNCAKFRLAKTAGYTAGAVQQFRLETTSGKLIIDGHLA